MTYFCLIILVDQLSVPFEMLDVIFLQVSEI